MEVWKFFFTEGERADQGRIPVTGVKFGCCIHTRPSVGERDHGQVGSIRDQRNRLAVGI